MSKDDEFEQIVNPLLLKIAEICKSLGMSFAARIEWSDDDHGICYAKGRELSVRQYEIMCPSFNNIYPENNHLIEKEKNNNDINREHRS